MTKGISPRPRSVHRTGTTTMASGVPFLNLKPFFAPHFSAADIKFICANMRLYTILIGTSETEKSAPHFRACFTKNRNPAAQQVVSNFAQMRVQLAPSEPQRRRFEAREKLKKQTCERVCAKKGVCHEKTRSRYSFHLRKHKTI